MKDFIGNELLVGDKVAVTRKPYHSLRMMYVVGFTEKCIKCSDVLGGKPTINPFNRHYVVKIFNQ